MAVSVLPTLNNGSDKGRQRDEEEENEQEH